MRVVTGELKLSGGWTDALSLTTREKPTLTIHQSTHARIHSTRRLHVTVGCWGTHTRLILTLRAHVITHLHVISQWQPCLPSQDQRCRPSNNVMLHHTRYSTPLHKTIASRLDLDHKCKYCNKHIPPQWTFASCHWRHAVVMQSHALWVHDSLEFMLPPACRGRAYRAGQPVCAVTRADLQRPRIGIYGWLIHHAVGM